MALYRIMINNCFKYRPEHKIGDFLCEILKFNPRKFSNIKRLGPCDFSDKPTLECQIISSFNLVRLYSDDTKKSSTDLKIVETTHTQGNTKGHNKKTLDGGVVIVDLIIGNGLEAKRGKTISVLYSGKLKSTNKVFDEVTSGAGLSFRLGRGDVIDGWDIGVVGMKVGGKRIITCPPAMAYGVKGYPPVIPPNSTLIFEVEVKDVK